jgi:hypothetical protein
MSFPYSDHVSSPAERLGDLKLFRAMFVVFAITWFIGGVLLSFTSSTLYAEQQPNETQAYVTVKSIGYGVTAKTAKPEFNPGENRQTCYLTLAGEKEPLRYAPAACTTLEVGQRLSVFMNGEAIRVDPQAIPAAFNGTKMLSYVGFALSGASTIAALVVHRRIRRTWDNAIDKLLAEGLE